MLDLNIYQWLAFIAVFISSSVMSKSVIKEDISIGAGERVVIDSEILKEERHLLVHLPSSYTKSNDKYPVLYLLDGERHFAHSILASRLLQEQNFAPELIIVAIPNVNGNTRQRDLGLETEKFTSFLRNEVMTYIKENYRASDSNTLYGHSLAGYYAVSVLANYPELFDNYIAAGPPLQTKESEFYKKIASHESLDKSLYFSSANQAEEGKRVMDALNTFVEKLEEKSPEKFNWKYELLADQTHITGYYLSLFKGMMFVFRTVQLDK